MPILQMKKLKPRGVGDWPRLTQPGKAEADSNPKHSWPLWEITNPLVCIDHNSYWATGSVGQDSERPPHTRGETAQRTCYRGKNL